LGYSGHFDDSVIEKVRRHPDVSCFRRASFAHHHPPHRPLLQVETLRPIFSFGRSLLSLTSDHCLSLLIPKADISIRSSTSRKIPLSTL
jgi:hypothetical protein